MKAIKTLLAVAALACGLGWAGGTAQAQSVYGKATRAEKKVTALWAEVDTHMAAADYDSALDKLDAILELDPKNVKALVKSAWIHNEQKDYEDASDAALEAVVIDPANAAAWRELGFADWKQGDLTEAKANLKLAIELDPKDLNAYDYLVQVLEQNGEKRAAKKVQKQKEDAELDALYDTTKSKRDF